MTAENPTEILREEHDKVLEILDKLENALKDKDVESSGKNIVTLEKEFDKHSLHKEEKALFPEIEKFIPRDGGPTGIMIIEHKSLVESIKNFKEAIETKNSEKLIEIGSYIINLLRQHIDKENSILFMMADMHLDDKQKEAILKEFKKFDSESRK